MLPLLRRRQSRTPLAPPLWHLLVQARPVPGSLARRVREDAEPVPVRTVNIAEPHLESLYHERAGLERENVELRREVETLARELEFERVNAKLKLARVASLEHHLREMRRTIEALGLVGQ